MAGSSRIAAQVIRKVKENTVLPVIAKLSPNVTDVKMAVAVERCRCRCNFID